MSRSAEAQKRQREAVRRAKAELVRKGRRGSRAECELVVEIEQLTSMRIEVSDRCAAVEEALRILREDR